MSDHRSQLRAARRKKRDDERRRQSVAEKPWYAHEGNSASKRDRLVGHLHQRARRLRKGELTDHQRDLIGEDLEWALRQEWMYAVTWLAKRGPKFEFDVAVGKSGFNLAKLESLFMDLTGCSQKSAVYAISREIIAGPMADRFRGYEPTQYEPHDWRIAFVPKKNGKKRQIKVSEPIDAIVEAVLLMLLAPFLHDLTDVAIAFRKGIGDRTALLRMHAWMRQAGYDRVLLADVRGAYDNLRWCDVHAVLVEKIPSRKVVALVMAVLTRGRWRHYKNGKGIPQGCPLSPMIMNALLDKILDRPWLERYPQWRIIRYADDVLVLAESKNEARAAHRALKELLQPYGLELAANKTRNACLTTTPVDWLGHRISVVDGHLVISTPVDFFERIDGFVSDHGRDRERLMLSLEGFLGYHAPGWAFMDRQELVKTISIRIADNATASINRRKLVQELSKVVNEQWKRWRDRLRADGICRTTEDAVSLETKQDIDGSQGGELVNADQSLDQPGHTGCRRPYQERTGRIQENPDRTDAPAELRTHIGKTASPVLYAGNDPHAPSVCAPRTTDILRYGEATASNEGVHDELLYGNACPETGIPRRRRSRAPP
jgi:hypothetical protein